MKLSLVPKKLVDLAIDGINVRMSNDVRQLGISDVNAVLHGTGGKFTDLGLVEYMGNLYYASTFDPPDEGNAPDR